MADQDCDLAWQALTGSDDPFLVELRPAFAENAPLDWGIRSRRLRVDEDGRHLRADAPSIRVTPDLLTVAEHVSCMDRAGQQRLKTWLGLRYDRPAVPQTYVDLARALAEQLSKKRHRAAAARVRDVLAQFWTDDDGSTAYSLIAVLPGGPFDAADADVVDVRRWLSEAALAVPSDLGTATDLHAYGDEEVSLAFVEGSFSLDLSKLSWPPTTPGPMGAT